MSQSCWLLRPAAITGCWRQRCCYPLAGPSGRDGPGSRRAGPRWPRAARRPRRRRPLATAARAAWRRCPRAARVRATHRVHRDDDPVAGRRAPDQRLGAGTGRVGCPDPQARRRGGDPAPGMINRGAGVQAGDAGAADSGQVTIHGRRRPEANEDGPGRIDAGGAEPGGTLTLRSPAVPDAGPGTSSDLPGSQLETRPPPLSRQRRPTARMADLRARWQGPGEFASHS